MKTLKLKTAVLSALLLVFGLSTVAQGYGEIRGIIKNTELEPVEFATVKILQGNVLIGGTQTDAQGRYKYKPLNPGTYDLVIIEAGASDPTGK